MPAIGMLCLNSEIESRSLAPAKRKTRASGYAGAHPEARDDSFVIMSWKQKSDFGKRSPYPGSPLSSGWTSRRPLVFLAIR